MPEIAHVYVFPNGMTAVFDEHGQQMPEFQGYWREKRAAIEAAKSPSTQVHLSAEDSLKSGGEGSYADAELVGSRRHP